MNKQIEMMAKDIRTAETNYLCAMVTADIDDAIDGAAPRNERLAAALYEKGYRMAVDVVEDVMTQLDDMGYLNIEPYAVNVVEAELKKKYESEGADDEN